MKLFYTLCVFSLSCFQLLSQTQFSNPGKLSLHQETKADIAFSQDGITHALILVDSSANDSVFLSRGIVVNSKFNTIWSIQVPSEKLWMLAETPGIVYAEISSRANAARFKNDIERQVSSVDKVQNGQQNGLPLNYSGKNVVVGIVDIGFQCNNPTFYTSDGSRTRIKRLWLQNDPSGSPPNGFSYGREISDTTLIQLANDMDGTHATHVAGIAAGSGYSTPGLQYRGMAPAADLVFVSIKYSNDTIGGSALGDYVVANPTILDAYRYIFDYAASVGKPAVINLSWGMHTGPHDGSSLFDQATEMLVGKGKILVGANGNEGDNAMHWNHQFNADTVGTIMIENGRQYRSRESVYSDFWGSANSSFSIQIQMIDTNKQVIVQTPFISSKSNKVNVFNFTADSSVFKIVLACDQKNPNNNKPNITVKADHQNQRKYAIVAKITSDSSLVHGWNSGAVKEWTSGSFQNKLNQIDFSSTYIAGNTDYTAGENGGTSKSVISVGAYAARSAYLNIKGKWINDSNYVTPGNIAKFSSKGPTVDGRVKPDITAPGFDIPSSINNKQVDGWMPDKTLLKTAFRNDSNYWTAFNGTSMAAPHVTGIVALLLQANPNLNAAQMRDILTTTATSDQYTGTVPNNTYGYGKVNAYLAIVKALQYAGINAYQTEKGINIYPNPAQDILSIELPVLHADASIEIIGMDGKAVLIIKDLSSLNTYQIDIQALAAGVYFIRFKHGGQLFVYKLIKT